MLRGYGISRILISSLYCEVDVHVVAWVPREDRNMKEADKTEEEKKITETDEGVVYELGYHLLSTIPQEQLQAEVGNIKEVIEKHGGVFGMEESPAPLRLAYTMVRKTRGQHERHSSAHFGWIKFEIPQGVIGEIKKELDLNQNILRFLIIRTVLEDTRAGKNVPLHNEPKESRHTNRSVSRPEKKVKTEISEDELDRTISKLVVD